MDQWILFLCKHVPGTKNYRFKNPNPWSFQNGPSVDMCSWLQKHGSCAALLRHAPHQLTHAASGVRYLPRVSLPKRSLCTFIDNSLILPPNCSLTLVTLSLNNPWITCGISSSATQFLGRHLRPVLMSRLRKCTMQHTVACWLWLDSTQNQLPYA